jgi:hypothetical protein
MSAWNPIQDELIYRISARIEQKEERAQQLMVLSPLKQGCQE